MSKKNSPAIWDFDVRKERIKNQYTGEETGFFGLFRTDNKNLLHISGKNFEAHSFKDLVNFMDSLNVVADVFVLKEENIHVIRDGKILILTVTGVKHGMMSVADGVRYDISLVATHDSSMRLQAHLQPVHVATGVYLPSQEIRQFFDFYESGNINGFISAYHNAISNVHDTFHRLMSVDFEHDEYGVRQLLKRFFPNGDGVDKTKDKKITRERNRFRDVLNAFVSPSWVDKKTQSTLWRFFIEFQGKDQFSWCRSISDGETFFSNTFGNTQKQCKSLFAEIMSYLDECEE